MISGKGPYLNLEKAAEYCGYAPSTFSAKVKDFSIPRKGDSENRFAVRDLDRWMDNPNCFVEEARYIPIRKLGGFTRVTV